MLAKRPSLWFAMAIAIITAFVYWPGLSGPFLFDDFPAVVDNAGVHPANLSMVSLWKAAWSFDPGGAGRPLAMASFALNYGLDGLEPWGFKLGGLLVHLCNTVFVYFLCVRLLQLAKIGGGHQRQVAFAVTLLWAIHPLQISTVLYVVQRMETLSLTFVLAALLAYLSGRQRQVEGRRGWPWILVCVPLVMLGLASKETALLFPVYALAIELTIFNFSAGTVRTQRALRLLYVAGCVVALLLFVAIVVPHYAVADAYVIRSFDAGERVLTQLRVLPMYLGQVLWPVPGAMTFYYDDYAHSTSLLSPITTLVGGVFLVLLLVAALFLRKRAPLFSLGVLWFLGAHAITSNVIALELVFEHRNYFALLGVLLALADLVFRIPVRDGPGVKYVAVIALLIGVGLLGLLRAATWGDRLLLASEFVSLNQRSARAAHELGVLYYEMSDGSQDSPFYSFAKSEFEREAKLPSASILAEQALILMDAGHGLPVDARLWEGLRMRLKTQPITPQTTAALFALLENRNKGVVLDDDQLGEAFMTLFERTSLPPFSYVDVAEHALRYRHRPDLAGHLINEAIRRGKEFPGYLAHLERSLRAKGYAQLADQVRDAE